MCETDLPISLPTPLDVDYHRHAEATFLRHPIAYLLPDRVTHAFPTTRRRQEYCGFSITGFDMDGPEPVREYQPVIHRLRLSASP